MDPALRAAPQAGGPRGLADLYWSFTCLALQGFGGVLAVAQRELVEKKRWLTQAEFVEEWAVAQIMPGPNVVNLALMIGDRYFGLRGALSALAGMLSLPMVVVLSLAALYAPIAQTPAALGALRGMGAVCAGLIAATGLKLLPALAGNPLPASLRVALVPPLPPSPWPGYRLPSCCSAWVGWLAWLHGIGCAREKNHECCRERAARRQRGRSQRDHQR
jgi:chromate transporter